MYLLQYLTRLNRWGDTALHEASKHNHILMARLLLERGADVNATTKCEPQHMALARRVALHFMTVAVISGGARVRCTWLLHRTTRILCRFCC